MDAFWLQLAAKMATSAGIVVTASLLVERAGPLVGAAIATLPISAGPAYAFLAAEHGPAFIAESTVTSLAVNAATLVLILVYAALAQRRNVLVSIGTAFSLWLAAAWVVFQLPWNFTGAAALNAAVFALVLPLARRYRVASAAPPRRRLWWEIPARAAAVMALVFVVVMTGRLIGPRAAGIAALVPVVLTSLALILHPRIGGPATAAVIASGMPGMAGFALGIAVLHFAAVPLGSAPALVIALAVCVGWNTVLLLRQRAQALRRLGTPKPPR